MCNTNIGIGSVERITNDCNDVISTKCVYHPDSIPALDLGSNSNLYNILNIVTDNMKRISRENESLREAIKEIKEQLTV